MKNKVLLLIASVCSLGASLAVADTYKRDMDHGVQYSQKKVSDRIYLLEVRRQNKVNFARMNMFATRHAYKLCQGYGFNIEYLGGIEEYDTKRQMPNRILPSLKVRVTCPTQPLPESPEQW